VNIVAILFHGDETRYGHACQKEHHAGHGKIDNLFRRLFGDASIGQ
jgi:hypothetical protein